MWTYTYVGQHSCVDLHTIILQILTHLVKTSGPTYSYVCRYTYMCGLTYTNPLG